MHFKFTVITLAAASVPAFANLQLIYPRQDTGDDLQTSLTLSPDLVQPGSGKTGQEDPTPGQVESLTSVNNFINHCALFKNTLLTNGQQIFQGSCNGIPMGQIMAKNKMPSAAVQFPKNNDVIQEGADITFKIAVKNLHSGIFTNAQLTYYSAPAQLDNNGILFGHSHITVNKIASLDSTDIPDPETFAFFKGLNDPDVGGILSATAVGGLKAGVYRACSMTSGGNHAPVIPPVAQRASLDDCIRFTVSAAGADAGANAGAGAGNAAGNAGNAGGNAGNAGGNAGNAAGNAGNAAGNAGSAAGNAGSATGSAATATATGNASTAAPPAGTAAGNAGAAGGKAGTGGRKAPPQRGGQRKGGRRPGRRSFSPSARSRVTRH